MLVTGAGGYLGSRLVGSMPGAVALVRTPVEYLTVEQRACDLAADDLDLAALFEGASAVVHLAGHNEVVSASEPDRALAETVVASRRVADAARRAGVPRVVYVSTVHVYGSAMDRGGVLDAATTVPAPRSVYAVARLASEHAVTAALGGEGDAVILRLTNAVGAPAAPDVNRWTLVASDLCRQAVVDGGLTLRSSGRQWRDFIALADVCAAVVAAADPDRVGPGTYDLAAGEPNSVLGLAQIVRDRFAARTGTELPLTTGTHEGPEPIPYRVAVGALAAQGLRATTPLADAVDELIDFCLANRERL